MKIIHVALGTPELDRSATELGHTVARIPWRSMLGRRIATDQVARLNSHILRVANDMKPDVVFCQLQTPGIMWHRTVNDLRGMGALVINWCGDVREPIPQWYIDDAAAFDITAFSNMTDVELVRAAGHRAEYLQIGYDETIYSPGTAVRSGVVFMGQNSGDRFPLSRARAQMVQAMREEFGHSFEAYGNGWGTTHLHADAEVDTYRRALIAINFDHFVRPRFASDRILRAQACGACTVSQWYEGIELEHPDVPTARTINDMVELVRELLTTPEVAIELGQRQARHVRASHTWHDRINTIHQWLDTLS